MTVRLGIIGLGWVFHNFHLPIWKHLQDVKVVAVSDMHHQTAEEVALLFDASAYHDPRDLIQHAQIDALYLLLPPYAHGELELLAIQRRVPFFIEKPVALDLQLARQIEHEVAKTHLITSVGYHRRYSWPLEEIRRTLIGRTPALIHGSWMSLVPPVSWWGKQRFSGGQLVEQATHMLDLFRYCFGEVGSVFGHQARRLIRQDDFDVADVTTLVLQFLNGAIGTLAATCAMPPGCSRVTLQIVCDQISVELLGENLHIHTTTGTQVMHHPNTPERNPYVKEGNAFLEAVRSGDGSGIRSSYSDAVRTLELALAARRSAETGTIIYLESGKLA